VEILDEAERPVPVGAIGSVYVTSLTNDCMPLVRYRVGDLAILSDEKCSCGLQTRLMVDIEGRTDDTITTDDGRKIGRLDHIFKQGGEIREAQIIQEKPGMFTFNIVPGEGYSETTLAKLRKFAMERLGKASIIRMTMVESISKSAGGKFRSVIVRKNNDVND
jgi:phenylacetate-CoA ligase